MPIAARAVPNEPGPPAPWAMGEASRPRPAQRVPPHSAEAEEALLGALLLTREALAEGLAHATADDLYRPAHAQLFAAMASLHARGEPVDPVTLRAEMRPADLEGLGGAGALVSLMAACPSTSGAGRYAGIVARAAARRRAIAALAEATEAAYAGDDEGAREALAEAADVLSGGCAPAEPDDDLDAFLDVAEPEYDWVVPGLIERGDRVILTAAEGVGKSTLLRQAAVQLASGTHPFTGEAIVPARVLYVDCENPPRLLRRKLRPLRAKARGTPCYDPANLVFKARPEGLDLHAPDDARWLEGCCERVRPDVVLIGPLYKLASEDPNEERTAKLVAALLDRLRVRHGFALVLEAHTPNEASTGGRRVERPFGWSGWRRWPEFGLFLAPDGSLRHWRGARDERDWPAALKRGGAWPWEAVTDARGVTFAGVMGACRDAGEMLSYQELGRRLGAHPQQVKRAVEANRPQWDHLARVIADGEEF
jgi:replicative DNA helicase